MLEDRMLIRRFNAGDAGALRRIYEKYKPELLAVASSLVADRSAVEDVLHDVFVRFASEAGRFQMRGSLNGYLAVCVANRARNVNRRERQTGSRHDSEGVPETAARVDPGEVAADAERRDAVTAAVDQLPQEQRQVIVLHVLGGLRFRQIAQQTGDSINTVQSRYRYGLEKLQSMLNGQVEP
jgi:RNA polymerase sigma-70 factor (ECF subfamily)